jgi:hypothetical protein
MAHNFVWNVLLGPGSRRWPWSGHEGPSCSPLPLPTLRSILDVLLAPGSRGRLRPGHEGPSGSPPPSPNGKVDLGSAVGVCRISLIEAFGTSCRAPPPPSNNVLSLYWESGPGRCFPLSRKPLLGPHVAEGRISHWRDGRCAPRPQVNTHFPRKGWLMRAPWVNTPVVFAATRFVARFPAESRLPMYKPLGLRGGPFPHHQVRFCLSLSWLGPGRCFSLAPGASPSLLRHFSPSLLR